MRHSFLVIFSFFTITSLSAFPGFTIHEIDRHGRQMGQTELADIDKDGDLDYVVGASGTMWWYEFRSADEWIRHDIGEGAVTDVGGCVMDVDQDGWPDVVTGTGWYRNTGNPREEPFVLYLTGAIESHDNVPVDINGDGKLDILACSNDEPHPYLNWYEIPEDPKSAWKEYRIGPGIHGGVDPVGFGDLDMDGDMDVARGDAWFENLDGKGTKWEMHHELIPPGGNRPDRYGLAIKTWVFDLDLDGDLDIVEAEADTTDGRVFWFENDGKAAEWKFNLISESSTKQDFHSLCLADFDNDGDMDVFSGGGPLSEAQWQSFIWENTDGKGGTWERHLILDNLRCHEAVAADIDQDGDIDICTKPWNGDLHLFIENRLK